MVPKVAGVVLNVVFIVSHHRDREDASCRGAMLVSGPRTAIQHSAARAEASRTSAVAPHGQSKAGRDVRMRERGGVELYSM